MVFDLDAELENEDEALIAWGAQKWLHHVVGAGFRTWWDETQEFYRLQAIMRGSLAHWALTAL